MSEDELLTREVLGRFGQASRFLDHHDRKYELGVACEVTKEVLLRGAHDLVREAKGRPMVTSKSCDGTPMSVTHRSSVRQPSGKKIRVAGRRCEEFLVQSQFVRCDMGAGE